MKIKALTKDGIIEKELTQAEIEDGARKGVNVCKKEILKQKIALDNTPEAMIRAILEYLEIEV